MLQTDGAFEDLLIKVLRLMTGVHTPGNICLLAVRPNEA
jgi:hypothetical protein